MFLKRIVTFLTIFAFTLQGLPISTSIASEGDEAAGSFDDEENNEEEVATAEVEEESQGVGTGVWIAITGAILALFGGGSSEPLTITCLLYTSDAADE